MRSTSVRSAAASVAVSSSPSRITPVTPPLRVTRTRITPTRSSARDVRRACSQRTLLALLGSFGMRGALPPWWRHLTGFRSDVYWWEPDGRVARISPGDGIYFMACIHPDGHHTVFWGGSEGRPRLWIADGSSAPEALTDDRRSARFPAYSADGRTLAYSASTHPSETVKGLRRDSTADRPCFTRADVDRSAARRRSRTRLDGRHQDQRPALSPDGKYVAFISDRLGRNGLWITHADGLTPPRPLLVDRPVYRPWWSIDGRRIFFFTFGRRHQVHCVSACGRQADAARERRPRIQPRPIRRPGRSASHRALDARGARGSECLGALRASARRWSSAAVDATGARAGRARHARAERCRDVRREPHAVAHAMSEPPDLAGNAAVPAPGTSQVQMRVTVELQGEPEEVGLLLAQIAEAFVVANVDDPGWRSRMRSSRACGGQPTAPQPSSASSRRRLCRPST